MTAIVNVVAKEQPDVTSRHLIETIKPFLHMLKMLIPHPENLKTILKFQAINHKVDTQA